MIQMQTNLDVADNSGARRVMCIKVLVLQEALRHHRRRDRGLGQGGHSARPREEGRGDEAVVVRIRKDIKRPMARSSASTATRPC